jgi:ElaB/YqjD/DUF883 family membrane-anchored ribosome-binding protein
MADANQNNELPEGTDAVIAGASNSGAIELDRATTDEGDAATLIIQDTDLSPTPEPAFAGAVQGADAGGGAGTDVVGLAATEVAGLAETDIAGTAAAAAAGGDTAAGGGTAAGGAKGITDRLRSGSEKLSGQVGAKARGLVSGGLEKSSEALANVSRMVGETADGIEERLGAEYGDYARRAAGAIENAANSLASKNPDELMEDTRTFVRNSPGMALAGAAVVGFVLARLVKSGLPASREDGNTDNDADDA